MKEEKSAQDIAINEAVLKLTCDIDELERRIILLERVFGRLMQIELRMDNLEFHSGQPLKPAINEVIMDMKLRLASLEEQVGCNPQAPLRNDE